MEELKLMRRLCLPISALNLLHYVKSMVTVLCLGRLGRAELAGGALAVGLTNVTGYSVLSGLALGLEPLAGQAFGSGTGRTRSRPRRALRRAVLLLLAASFPVAALWACAGPPRAPRGTPPWRAPRGATAATPSRTSPPPASSSPRASTSAARARRGGSRRARRSPWRSSTRRPPRTSVRGCACPASPWPRA
ncbi:hypothetical protein EE612_060164 [Oryza sativa]|nr:hypothetical protein EE612_060164 [Oryza sativa]